MIGALLTFFLLFGLIKIFERKRDDLDGFTIGTVAVVPVLALVVVNVVLAFTIPESVVALFLPFIVLVALTFGLLWKHLDIPIARSVGYTMAVVTFNIVLGLFFASGS